MMLVSPCRVVCIGALASLLSGRPSFYPIAERIRSIGHVAPGSYAEFGRLGSLLEE